MSEELTAKKNHLEALETFMKGLVYKGYLAGVEHDIKNIQDAIIAVEPMNRETEIENFKLRGELRNLISNKTLFEDARRTLKDRIDELAELELKTASNTKI